MRKAEYKNGQVIFSKMTEEEIQQLENELKNIPQQSEETEEDIIKQFLQLKEKLINKGLISE